MVPSDLIDRSPQDLPATMQIRACFMANSVPSIRRPKAGQRGSGVAATKVAGRPRTDWSCLANDVPKGLKTIVGMLPRFLTMYSACGQDFRCMTLMKIPSGGDLPASATNAATLSASSRGRGRTSRSTPSFFAAATSVLVYPARWASGS